MFEEYTRIALVLDICKRIKSKAILHQMIFIAKVLGYPFKEHFLLEMDGPYSTDLAEEIMRMDELKMIKIKKEGSIVLANGGRSLLSNFGVKIMEEFGGKENRKKIERLFTELKNRKGLEITATIIYILDIRERGIEGIDEAIERVKKIKPKFHPKNVEGKREIVRKLIGEYKR